MQVMLSLRSKQLIILAKGQLKKVSVFVLLLTDHIRKVITVANLSSGYSDCQNQERLNLDYDHLGQGCPALILKGHNLQDF